VVDAFYVRGPDGAKVTDAHLIGTLEATIERRVAEHRQAESPDGGRR
jgi:hypothetical protein